MWQTLFKASSMVHRYLSLLLIIGLLVAPYQPTYTHAQTTDSIDSVETTTEEAPDEDPIVLIETGTADAITDAYNFSNTNEIQTTTDPAEMASSTTQEAVETSPNVSDSAEETASSETDAAPATDETSTESIPTEDTTEAEMTSTSTASTTLPAAIIEIENQATSTTAATTSAATGDNNATTSTNGAAIISTGDANAYTNVVNLTNSNIINSDGFIVFLNQLFGTTNIDFRDMFDVFSDAVSTSDICQTDDCQAGRLETYTANQTTISNNITVVADTGNNQATGGTAAVLTGDAYAAANVTNVANTTIVDANYLVMTFSNFGDLFGDMILPGANLLDKLFQSSPAVQTDATIVNDATINNQVSANANTGNNTSTGSSSVIETGNATAYTNVYNQTNTNAVQSDSFTLLLRVHGDWTGNVFGLPEGLSYEHTPAGITISNANSQTTPALSNSISATITNETLITNNVSVEANTGGNQAYGDDLGFVSTGDAYAAANITNVANTNILGRNWSLLIFDIFGDWQGDISFGQPDIWIGGTANAINGTTAAGSEVLYTFTISNLGDATAQNVILNGDLSSDLMRLKQPIEDIQLGSIAPGETVEMTYVADVADSLPSGSFPVDLEADVTSSGPDANLDNNHEVVTVIAENKTYRGGGRSSANRSVITKEGDVLITKSASVDAIEPGEIVTYEVTLTNSGGPIYDAILYDTLYDSAGEVMLDQNWPLYTIDTDETITINYDVKFATSTAEGTYFNRAQMLGYHKNTNPKYMETYDSMVASVPVTIGKQAPMVLGIATSTECAPYLTSFLKYNQKNDTENVRRLQTFLKEQGSFTAPITGYFDSSTAAAVKTFQQQHAAAILTPWGLTSPTGHVYYTTQKTINELKCANEKTFPLTIAQATEIERYKQYSVPTITAPATPIIPPPEPVVQTQAVLPKPVPMIEAPALTQNKPLSRTDTSNSEAPTTEETVSSVRKKLSNLIQRGVRTFSQLKFW